MTNPDVIMAGKCDTESLPFSKSCFAYIANGSHSQDVKCVFLLPATTCHEVQGLSSSVPVSSNFVVHFSHVVSACRQLPSQQKMSAYSIAASMNVQGCKAVARMADWLAMLDRRTGRQPGPLPRDALQ